MHETNHVIVNLLEKMFNKIYVIILYFIDFSAVEKYEEIMRRRILYVSFIKQLMQCLRSCNDEVLFGVSYIIRPEYVFKIRESY